MHVSQCSELQLGVWGSRLQITEMHLTKCLGNEEQPLASCEKYGLALVMLPVEALLQRLGCDSLLPIAYSLLGPWVTYLSVRFNNS